MPGSATQVLVAGAGPTGLALALWLSPSGVRARVIRTEPPPPPPARALPVHTRHREAYPPARAARAGGRRTVSRRGGAGRTCRARLPGPVPGAGGPRRAAQLDRPDRGRVRRATRGGARRDAARRRPAPRMDVGRRRQARPVTRG